MIIVNTSEIVGKEIKKTLVLLGGILSEPDILVKILLQLSKTSLVEKLKNIQN